ncbi:Uncharacterised protein [Bordetella pertussis]|nr:Uncharacterised protein [Bordetella pertussis]CFO77609.1 Uncharacterised protein [Bordetella pertussis]CFU88545.1 Uncharacterised protein [Bordetella pertussis]CPM24090.1 Uncharacterised protein [Bordetella pertussis]CPN97053.1 Uncharacterised protein [Bordetella pertussis]
MGVPRKRPVPRSIDDQKSTSLARWTSQSSTWVLKIGPNSASRRTSA